MKLIMLWVFAVLAFVLPGSAFASGMYLPWYAETFLFLVGTPAGWVVLSGILAVVVVAVLKAAKRRKR